jgi:GTPase
MLVSYNIPVVFVVTHIDMALEESCNIVDRDIKDLCKQYRRNVEILNGYDKYHSYQRGANLVNKLAITNMNHEEITRLNLTENEITDINEYLNFDTAKMSMVSEINQGLNMAGGKQNYIPVIYVSNVDGYCLDVIKQAMMTVEARELWSNDENANSIVKFFRTKLDLPTLGIINEHIGSTFYIDHTYNVKGVGIVVSGINRGDKINVNDELYLGPINKEFIKIKLRSMHNDDRTVIDSMNNHHRGCIAIKALKDELRKPQIVRGSVLISNSTMIKNVCFRFEAAVTIFGGHSATLRTGYSPVIHAGTIRQTAKLILPELTAEETLLVESNTLSKHEKPQRKIKSGDVDKVIFKFRFRPEYLDPGTVFVFRSGDLHGVGCVINVTPLENDPDAQPEPLKKKFRKIRPVDINKAREAREQRLKKTEKIIVNF